MRVFRSRAGVANGATDELQGRVTPWLALFGLILGATPAFPSSVVPVVNDLRSHAWCI